MQNAFIGAEWLLGAIDLWFVVRRRGSGLKQSSKARRRASLELSPFAMFKEEGRSKDDGNALRQVFAVRC